MVTVVVVGIGIYFQPTQQPADTKFLMVLIFESIILYSISFVKNAATFLGTLFPSSVHRFPFLVRDSLSWNRILLRFPGLSGILHVIRGTIWRCLL